MRPQSMLLVISALIVTTAVVVFIFEGNLWCWVLRCERKVSKDFIVESKYGVVAADDGRCSEIGVSILKDGGHAVDAAVATALCQGVVNPMSSGIGGGAFMLVQSSATEQTRAYISRETAPSAASENMYEDNPKAKHVGPLSIAVPGELAGLHEAWLKYGRVTWRSLFQPAIRLAKDGFTVAPFLGFQIATYKDFILADPGLQEVFAPNEKLLQVGDTCYNEKLGQSLEEVAEHGPQVFYNGTVGEKLVKDVQEAGGILTIEDLIDYKVKVTDATTVNAMGFTILGMPSPSSGTLGLSLVLHIFESYGDYFNAVEGSLGVHRLIEAVKHMLAIRMGLGDPDFVDITQVVSDMLSPSYAEQIRRQILDDTTFPPEYYMNRYSQLIDHGTSHFCIVDADRNAVSMTTTINAVFGAKMRSPSTGILLNNEMDDFSMPTEISTDKLPPAPANFIRPNKRPLSSMTPLIIMQKNQLVGVIGCSGSVLIMPAAFQVFLNYFIKGMNPLDAVKNPRIYHKVPSCIATCDANFRRLTVGLDTPIIYVMPAKNHSDPTLIPNVVLYENWTVIDGVHIELSQNTTIFLKERGHQLEAQAAGAVCQLIVQNLQNPIDLGRKHRKDSDAQKFHGNLTAVSDPRKGGRPAAV